MSTPFLQNSQRHNCYTPSTPSSYPALLEPSDRQIVNAFWCVSSHLCASSGLPSTQDQQGATAREISARHGSTPSQRHGAHAMPALTATFTSKPVPPES
ncbi:hypothetical protein CABS01_05058 [Colletotrichum abscissum]|uniref:Uncharacterized protein n=1 Tax=Colletotrichum abscissum TaxID=1671311 RepID=A0A9P9X576_9PEZI|nr:uncharacterized protein CABS01_05058 [Colletotrichum abscissum]KAI3537006.1 hypothetical protein CABS02_12280 [Colletotrichum abscissum]KAK1523437.1 hypothetical protein CABS01_05058 [Colletotrichum abscissum]